MNRATLENAILMNNSMTTEIKSSGDRARMNLIIIA